VKKPPTLHKYLYTGADPVNKVDPSGRMEATWGIAITLPTWSQIAAAGIATAKVALTGAITVFAAYLATEAIDCRQQIRRCVNECAEYVSEEPHFDVSDIRRCVRRCLELLGNGCDDHY
jgi:hypothetical protein